MNDTPRTPPWDGCMACGHAKHPYRPGDSDVRCNAITNLHGDPSNGPEYCECIQWEDVLAAYQGLDAQVRAALRGAGDTPAPPTQHDPLVTAMRALNRAQRLSVQGLVDPCERLARINTVTQDALAAVDAYRTYQDEPAQARVIGVERMADALIESDLIRRYSEYAMAAYPRMERDDLRSLALSWAEKVIHALYPERNQP